MQPSAIETFNRDRFPSQAQLEAVCDLFAKNLPVFDDQNPAENAETIALRRTPDDYRRLLESKTLLLACRTSDDVAGLLEWDPRDKETVMLAFITWLLVDPNARGQKLSTRLHTEFENVCVPQVIQGAQKTTFQALAVHLKNPALGIYRHWGYSEDGAPQYDDGRRLFMIKSAVHSK